MEEKVQLNVRVSSNSPDPTPANNVATSLQKIVKAKVPRPPSKREQENAEPVSEALLSRLYDPVAGRVVRNKWHLVNSNPNLWIYVNNFSSALPIGTYDEQGSMSATMWIWETAHSRTIRFELENTLKNSGSGGLFSNDLRKTKKYSVPDTSASWYGSFSKQWTIGANWANLDRLYMRGTWKWIRAGHHRNKKYEAAL
jgi:hypothetical protein